MHDGVCLANEGVHQGGIADIALDQAEAFGIDLLGGAEFQPLSGVDGADVVGGIVEGLEGAGIQPGRATGQDGDLQFTHFQVAAVHIGDLQLAAR